MAHPVFGVDVSDFCLACCLSRHVLHVLNLVVGDSSYDLNVDDDVDLNYKVSDDARTMHWHGGET